MSIRRVSERHLAACLEVEGLVTLWCDASHQPGTNAAAIAVVRASTGSILRQRIIPTPSAHAAERAAVLDGFFCAQALVEAARDRDPARRVRVYTDCRGLERVLTPPDCTEVLFKPGVFNLAHATATCALRDHWKQQAVAA